MSKSVMRRNKIQRKTVKCKFCDKEIEKDIWLEILIDNQVCYVCYEDYKKHIKPAIWGKNEV